AGNPYYFELSATTQAGVTVTVNSDQIETALRNQAPGKAHAIFKAAQQGGKSGVLQLASDFDPFSLTFTRGGTNFPADFSPRTNAASSFIDILVRRTSGTPANILQFSLDVNQTLLNLDPAVSLATTFTNFTGQTMTFTQTQTGAMVPTIATVPTRV